MKIYPQKYGEGQLIVIARNLKTCIKEMKKDFPGYEYKKSLNIASNVTGELGMYYFKRINRDEIHNKIFN